MIFSILLLPLGTSAAATAAPGTSCEQLPLGRPLFFWRRRRDHCPRHRPANANADANATRSTAPWGNAAAANITHTTAAPGRYGSCQHRRLVQERLSRPLPPRLMPWQTQRFPESPLLLGVTAAATAASGTSVGYSPRCAGATASAEQERA